MKDCKMKYIAGLIYNIFKRMPVLTFITLLIPILAGTINVYVYNLYGKLINVIANDIYILDHSQIIKKLIIITGIYIMVQIIKIILEFTSKLVAQKLKYKIQISFRDEIIGVAEEVYCVRFDDSDFYNKLQRSKDVLEEDMTSIIDGIVVCISAVSSIASIIVLAILCKHTSIVILITILVVITLYVRIKIEINIRRLGIDLTFHGRQADYFKRIFEDSTSIREMRIYKSASYFYERWNTLITTQHKKRYSARENEIKAGALLSLTNILVIFLILKILITSTSNTTVSVGTVTALLIAMLSLNQYIWQIIFPITKLYVSSMKMSDLSEIINQRKFDKRIQVMDEIEDLNIELKNVSFNYINSTKKILEDINCNINKGEKIALVGENGAGKSTLIKLIMNQYKAAEGEVLYNGKQNNVVKMSVVFQSYMKIELSLRENIAISNKKDFDNDEKIMNVIKECDLLEVYNKLGSLDAPVGRIIDGAMQLSGGEWQKLAIARAIFCNASLVIFDEPTASVDPVSELEIFQRLIQMCQDKTAIFISHRLGFARNADRIIVLEDGKIIEEGTHDELLVKRGKYSSMYHIQARWYV